MRPHTVVIAHRDRMVAEGLAAALARLPGIVPISTVTSASAAAETGAKADAVALDAELDEARPTALELRRRGVRVVFIGTDPGDDEDVYIPLSLPASALASALIPGAIESTRDAIPLTKRQRQVLELISHGLAAKQVARSLGISPKTVERHKTILYAKLGVPNQAAAVTVGLRAAE